MKKAALFILLIFASQVSAVDTTNIDETLANAQNSLDSISEDDYTSWAEALLILGIIAAFAAIWHML